MGVLLSMCKNEDPIPRDELYHMIEKLQKEVKLMNTVNIVSQEKDGDVIRVSVGRQYVDLKRVPRPPVVGDKVKIIVKPYHMGKKIIGIVKRVLTKSKRHTRGYKVMLQDGTFGRTVEIL